jgi:hypothetical protein
VAATIAPSTMTDAELTEVARIESQAENLPVSTTVVAGDDCPLKWYVKPAWRISHTDPDHCATAAVFMIIMMRRHNRKHEEAADDMLVLADLQQQSHLRKRATHSRQSRRWLRCSDATGAPMLPL